MTRLGHHSSLSSPLAWLPTTKTHPWLTTWSHSALTSLWCLSSDFGSWWLWLGRPGPCPPVSSPAVFFLSSESSAIGLLTYSWTILQPCSKESANLMHFRLCVKTQIPSAILLRAQSKESGELPAANTRIKPSEWRKEPKTLPFT